jgi:Transposase DDE domain
MSFLSNDTAEDVTLQDLLTVDAWKREIVPLLPRDLEESAFLFGAMSRKGGKIQNASDLLRGLIAYCVCLKSFRSLGAWGVFSGIADMADTSWRERMMKSGDWLCFLLNSLLRSEKQQPPPRLKKEGYCSIKLVDASHVRCVGKKGTVFRFHCMYSLLTQQLCQVLVGTTKIAESMENFLLEKGTMYVHDGGYGYRGQIAKEHDAEAFSVTNFCPSTFPLEDAEGNALDLVAALKKLHAREGTIKSFSAFFQENGKRYEVRVIARRATKEQRERVLHQKQKLAKKNHRKLQKETLYLTGWVLVLTTLPSQDWSDQEVLSLYRARWMIEIFFKRVKQLLEMHILRAETEETAKVTVAVMLVSWVLQEGMAKKMRSVLDEMYDDLEKQCVDEPEKRGKKEERVINEWMLENITVALFSQQVYGVYSFQHIIACLPLLRRHLGEHPRKRISQWQRATYPLIDSKKGRHPPGGTKSRNAGSALRAALA